MNLQLTAQEQRFSAEVEAFLARYWPSEWRSGAVPGPRRQQSEQRYTAELAARGWLTGDWPLRHGGLGWDRRLRWLFDQAAAQAIAPLGPVQGPRLVGPLIIEFGTAGQQAALLPPICEAHVEWAQALDDQGWDTDTLCIEPDLIEATISPADNPSQWCLSGGKSWIFEGDRDALWLCLLARVAHSDDLVVLLVDAATAGVRLEPRAMIGDPSGRHSVQSVVFEDVHLTNDALLGEIGQGGALWQRLQRLELALAGATGRNAVLLSTLRSWAQGDDPHSGELWSDDDFRADIHAAEIELAGLSALEQRALLAPDSASDFANAASLGLAARGAELGQRLADLQVSALGYFALPFVDLTAIDNEGSIGPEFAQPALLGMLSDRARGAIGVSGEHLKNVIAKSVLALPQDESQAPDQ